MNKIDKDKAQTNPASVFGKPDDIVKNRDMTAREKTNALREWELDAKLNAVAAEEGVTRPDEEAAAHKKNNPLPEIKKAQADMGVDPAREKSAPTEF